MKNQLLLFIALYFLQLGTGVAQIMESFEAPNCQNTAYAFSTGCINDWISGSGTPDIRTSFPSNITASDGLYFAHMYTRYRWECTPEKETGETIVLNYPFDPSKTYMVTYDIFGDVGGFTCFDVEASWYLTNGITNTQGTGGNCGALLPLVQPSDLLVYEAPNVKNASTWQTQSFQFTNANYSQLWFRPFPNLRTGCAANTEASYNIFLDNFSLTEVVCQNIATSYVWPSRCILNDADFSGEIELCPDMTISSGVLEFLKNGQVVASTPIPTINTSSWSHQLHLHNDLVGILGLSFGESYDFRPVFTLANGDVFYGSEFQVGQNNDINLGGISSPTITVNTSPTSALPSMSKFCADEEIWFYGVDPLSSRYHLSLRGRPVGTNNWNWQSLPTFLNTFNGATGDIRNLFNIQTGWEYVLKVGAYNIENCIAWSAAETAFSVVACEKGCDDIPIFISTYDIRCERWVQATSIPGVTVTNVIWDWGNGDFDLGPQAVYTYTTAPVPSTFSVIVIFHLPSGKFCTREIVRSNCFRDCPLQRECKQIEGTTAPSISNESYEFMNSSTPANPARTQSYNQNDLVGDTDVSLTAYPIPASDNVTFDIVAKDQQNGFINIYDLNGKVVKQTHVDGRTSIRVDISEITGGVYFYNFTGANNVVTNTQKLIIVR